jgi:hypothetical protein
MDDSNTTHQVIRSASLLFLLPPPSPLFLRVGWPFLYTYSPSLHYIIRLPSFTYKGVSFFLIVSYFWEGVTVSGGYGSPLSKGSLQWGYLHPSLLASWGCQPLGTIGHGSPLGKGSSQREYPRPRQIPFEGGARPESFALPNDKGVTFSPKCFGITRKGPVLWIGVDKRG